jgi:hypothetical protein
METNNGPNLYYSLCRDYHHTAYPGFSSLSPSKPSSAAILVDRSHYRRNCIAHRYLYCLHEISMCIYHVQLGRVGEPGRSTNRSLTSFPKAVHRAFGKPLTEVFLKVFCSSFLLSNFPNRQLSRLSDGTLFSNGTVLAPG